MSAIRLTPDYSTSLVMFGVGYLDDGTIVATEGGIRAWVAAVKRDDRNSTYGDVVPALDVVTASGALAPWALCITTDDHADPIVLALAGRDRDGAALYVVDPIGTWDVLA